MERLFAVAPRVYGILHAVACDSLLDSAVRHSAAARQALALRDDALVQVRPEGLAMCARRRRRRRGPRSPTGGGGEGGGRGPVKHGGAGVLR